MWQNDIVNMDSDSDDDNIYGGFVEPSEDPEIICIDETVRFIHLFVYLKGTALMIVCHVS